VLVTIQPQQAEKIGGQGRVARSLSLTPYFCLLQKQLIKLVATTGRDTFKLMADKTMQGFLYLRKSENYYCDAVDAFVSLN